MGLSETVGSIFDTLLNAFYFITFIGVLIFGYQLQTFNSFKQQVNYKIERHGGLLEHTVEELNEISEDQYGGWYSVKSDQFGQKVSFGEKVDYTIDAKYPVLFINKVNLSLQTKGQSISRVR